MRKHPDGHVFYRKMASARPLAVRAEGAWIVDDQGKRYLDASGGPLVVNVGHSHPAVVAAVREQLEKISYAHAAMFSTTASEELSERLARRVPIERARFFYLSSGSEVVEAGIKLARQIQQSRGAHRRHLVISREQSYHGMTLGALAQSGRPGLRAPYLDMMSSPPKVPPPYPYRDGLTGQQHAAVLEEKIVELGADNVAAFLAEPISGASLGACAPPDDYWPAVRDVCDRHGVLLIADEVLTGLGRTGTWWALDHWGVRPDILVSSKGTGGGTAPLGFVACAHDDVERIRVELGDFNHGGTFSHHPLACAAGLATLQILEDEGLIERARTLGKALGKKLRARLQDHRHVGDIRGRGMFWGIELVEDEFEKRPFSAGEKRATKVHQAAFESGLIVYYSQGCVDGERGDLVMLGPPFIVTDDELDLMVNGTARAIEEVCA